MKAAFCVLFVCLSCCAFGVEWNFQSPSVEPIVLSDTVVYPADQPNIYAYVTEGQFTGHSWDAAVIEVAWDVDQPISGFVVSVSDHGFAYLLSAPGTMVDTGTNYFVFRLKEPTEHLSFQVATHKAYGLYADVLLSVRRPEDVNDDGKVNLLDLVVVRNRLGAYVSPEQGSLADVNGDGIVNIIDLVAVRNAMQTQ